MAAASDNKGEKGDAGDGLRRAVELREKRDRRWREKGERSIGRNLAMMGALGWLMVAPVVLGAVVGHWIDEATGRTVTWAAALIFLGVGFGGYLVWRRMTEEEE